MVLTCAFLAVLELSWGSRGRLRVSWVCREAVLRPSRGHLRPW